MAEPLAVLLLPTRLEGFAREAQARELLAIPRVVALEASRVATPRLLRDGLTVRQARRLRFPGRIVLLVLYDATQYPLARALRDRHGGAELWYLPPPDDGAGTRAGGEATRWQEDDALARHHARAVLETPSEGAPLDPAPLRERLRELEVISPYAFDPRAPRR